MASKSPSPAELAWSAARNPGGELVLHVANDGETHARILNYTLAPTTGTAAPLQESVAAYVLPGATRTWTIDTNNKNPDGSTATADRYRLKANTERGEVDAELTVAR